MAYNTDPHTRTHIYIQVDNCWLVILLSERLADSLRLPQVIPSIQAQVFLCFRVLLLRMSPQHATSLWPVIVSELVQVFLYIEQELNTDSEEFRYANSSLIHVASGYWANSLMGRYCFVLCMLIYSYCVCSFCVYTQLVILFQILYWEYICLHLVSFVYRFLLHSFSSKIALWLRRGR